jgi:hypothetical protein
MNVPWSESEIEGHEYMWARTKSDPGAQEIGREKE